MLLFLGSSSAVAFAIGVFFLLHAASDIQLTAAVAAFGAGAILAGLTALHQQLKGIEGMVRSTLQLQAREAREGRASAVEPQAPHGVGVSDSAH